MPGLSYQMVCTSNMEHSNFQENTSADDDGNGI